jgi:hypothetical protein
MQTLLLAVRLELMQGQQQVGAVGAAGPGLRGQHRPRARLTARFSLLCQRRRARKLKVAQQQWVLKLRLGAGPAGCYQQQQVVRAQKHGAGAAAGAGPGAAAGAVLAAAVGSAGVRHQVWTLMTN